MQDYIDKFDEDARILKELRKNANEYQNKADEYQNKADEYQNKADELEQKMCTIFNKMKDVLTHIQKNDFSYANIDSFKPKTTTVPKYQMFVESNKHQPYKVFDNIQEAINFVVRIMEEMKLADPSVNIPKASTIKDNIRRWYRGKTKCTRFLVNGENVLWKEVFE